MVRTGTGAAYCAVALFRRRSKRNERQSCVTNTSQKQQKTIAEETNQTKRKVPQKTSEKLNCRVGLLYHTEYDSCVYMRILQLKKFSIIILDDYTVTEITNHVDGGGTHKVIILLELRVIDSSFFGSFAPHQIGRPRMWDAAADTVSRVVG